jgi:hypothetical protein
MMTLGSDPYHHLRCQCGHVRDAHFPSGLGPAQCSAEGCLCSGFSPVDNQALGSGHLDELMRAVLVNPNKR